MREDLRKQLEEALSRKEENFKKPFRLKPKEFKNPATQAALRKVLEGEGTRDFRMAGVAPRVPADKLKTLLSSFSAHISGPSAEIGQPGLTYATNRLQSLRYYRMASLGNPEEEAWKLLRAYRSGKFLPSPSGISHLPSPYSIAPQLPSTRSLGGMYVDQQLIPPQRTNLLSPRGNAIYRSFPYVPSSREPKLTSVPRPGMLGPETPIVMRPGRAGRKTIDEIPHPDLDYGISERIVGTGKGFNAVRRHVSSQPYTPSPGLRKSDIAGEVLRQHLPKWFFSPTTPKMVDASGAGRHVYATAEDFAGISFPSKAFTNAGLKKRAQSMFYDLQEKGVEKLLPIGGEEAVLGNILRRTTAADALERLDLLTAKTKDASHMGVLPIPSKAYQLSGIGRAQRMPAGALRPRSLPLEKILGGRLRRFAYGRNFATYFDPVARFSVKIKGGRAQDAVVQKMEQAGGRILGRSPFHFTVGFPNVTELSNMPHPIKVLYERGLAKFTSASRAWRGVGHMTDEATRVMTTLLSGGSMSKKEWWKARSIEDILGMAHVVGKSEAESSAMIQQMIEHVRRGPQANQGQFAFVYTPEYVKGLQGIAGKTKTGAGFYHGPTGMSIRRGKALKYMDAASKAIAKLAGDVEHHLPANFQYKRDQYAAEIATLRAAAFNETDDFPVRAFDRALSNLHEQFKVVRHAVRKEGGFRRTIFVNKRTGQPRLNPDGTIKVGQIWPTRRIDPVTGEELVRGLSRPTRIALTKARRDITSAAQVALQGITEPDMLASVRPDPKTGLLPGEKPLARSTIGGSGFDFVDELAAKRIAHMDMAAVDPLAGMGVAHGSRDPWSVSTRQVGNTMSEGLGVPITWQGQDEVLALSKHATTAFQKKKAAFVAADQVNIPRDFKAIEERLRYSRSVFTHPPRFSRVDVHKTPNPHFPGPTPSVLGSEGAVFDPAIVTDIDSMIPRAELRATAGHLRSFGGQGLSHSGGAGVQQLNTAIQQSAGQRMLTHVAPTPSSTLPPFVGGGGPPLPPLPGPPPSAGGAARALVHIERPTAAPPPPTGVLGKISSWLRNKKHWPIIGLGIAGAAVIGTALHEAHARRAEDQREHAAALPMGDNPSPGPSVPPSLPIEKGQPYRPPTVLPSQKVVRIPKPSYRRANERIVVSDRSGNVDAQAVAMAAGAGGAGRMHISVTNPPKSTRMDESSENRRASTIYGRNYE